MGLMKRLFLFKILMLVVVSANAFTINGNLNVTNTAAITYGILTSTGTFTSGISVGSTGATFQGNVSIGSTGALTKLQIGSFKNNGNTQLLLSDYEDEGYPQILINVPSGNYLGIGGDSNDDMVFGFAENINSVFVSTAMVIQQGGNVGIGTSSPGTLLTVGPNATAVELCRCTAGTLTGMYISCTVGTIATFCTSSVETNISGQ